MGSDFRSMQARTYLMPSMRRPVLGTIIHKADLNICLEASNLYQSSSLRQTVNILPDSARETIRRAAHHESGHIVIAAAQGLKLRPEGISVDLEGNGLACYCKHPEDNDLSRER